VTYLSLAAVRSDGKEHNGAALRESVVKLSGPRFTGGPHRQNQPLSRLAGGIAKDTGTQGRR